MQVTDAMVAKAAEVAYLRNRAGDKPWDDLSPEHKSEWREKVRPVITAALAEMWRPIDDLTREQEDNRILVAGWQKPSGRVAGYWWWHEDVVVDGSPMDHPEAQFWCVAHFALPVPPPRGK